MARWFLSYHSPDQVLAGRLKAAIERKDSASRVFFAPERLRAGGSWSKQLADEIDGADAFILLVGEKGVGDWQELEYDEALDKWVMLRKKSPGFPLIVVLLEGKTAPGLQFLRRMHWIVTRDPASDIDVARIFDAVASPEGPPRELWRYTSPYRGLEAMEEKDSDYFFGRRRETVEVLGALAASDRLPILIGNSGVGKSSLAKAGVLAALKRQAWPGEADAAKGWPAAFEVSRQWCFLSLQPGTDPLKALVGCFLDTWQYSATDPERVKQQQGWIELLQGKATLSDLLDATERRRSELDQPKPPAFFLYVDQGEELYVRGEERQRRRFSELLAQSLAEPRLRAMMSMRADFLGHLQADKPLFKARQHIDVPPLGEEELREVVSRPAQLLSARFESDGLIDIVTRRTAEDSVKDVGALPLLSYTLDDMWKQMVDRGDGLLRLSAPSFELTGVLVDRANTFLASHPGAEPALRRILTLHCATVRDDGEPTRRHAARAEFTDEEWQLVGDLANYPYRLLVIATTETGETYAEVAHEAIFRRWDKLKEWIAAEREFLAWRSGLEAARRAWAAMGETAKQQALLMGAALTQAHSWLAKRADDLPALDSEFIAQSVARENKVQARARRIRAGIYGLGAIVILGLIGWINQSIIENEWRFVTVTWPYERANIWPYVLSAAKEQALKPGDSFKECAQDCPEMVVVPAGSFMMGAVGIPAAAPTHNVTILKAFAVAKYEVTFADWDACVAGGGCNGFQPNNFDLPAKNPVFNVSWNDAQAYATWFSQVTGKTYRLLSEAEYEYAARAGTTTAYPWGDDPGTNNADCDGCGSKWDHQFPAPVGSFAANRFGLYDMVGNVWEWIEDCWHDNYANAPRSGSAWLAGSGGDCKRVIRGGSWSYPPTKIGSAVRNWNSAFIRNVNLGFRIARTLLAP